MLVLSRKSDQKITIGSEIVLTVVAVKGNRVTIGIDAPRSIQIQRSECLTGDTQPPEVSNSIPPCTKSLGAEGLDALVTG